MGNIDDFYKSMNITQSTISYQKISEFQDRITQMYQPIFKMTSSIQKQYDLTAAAVVPKMFEQMSASLLLPFSEALAKQNYQQQMLAIQNSIESFASTIMSMNIHSNYVSVPESLIPDNFSYEEVVNDSTNNSGETTEATTKVKKLSFSDTLSLIQMLFGALAWILSFLMTSQSSLQEQINLNDQIAIEMEGNRIQEERNQILQNQIESLQNQTECLWAIYNKIEEADSASPVSDSIFLGTDSVPSNPVSPPQCGGSFQSVETDGSDNFDTPHKVD